MTTFGVVYCHKWVTELEQAQSVDSYEKDYEAIYFIILWSESWDMVQNSLANVHTQC